jgi:hypothetical protein
MSTPAILATFFLPLLLFVLWIGADDHDCAFAADDLAALAARLY